MADLPRGWVEQAVDAIKANKDGSIAIGPFGSRMKADRYVPTGIPVIRGTNLSDTKAFRGEFVYVGEDTAAELPNCIVREGDLVFPHRGSIGEVGIVTHPTSRYMLSTSLMKLTCHRNAADPLYIFYYFRSPAGRHELLKNASQVGTPGIATPLASLRSLRVLLPPLPEQKAIAHVLGTLDDKIELNRRMNETLEAMARAIFKSWFVDFDPVRANLEGRRLQGLDPAIQKLFPDRFEDSPLGEIPQGWQASTVGDEFRLTMGQSPPSSTYNEAGDGLPFYQGRADFGFRFPSRRVYCTAPTRFAEAGDSLVSVRAPVGDVNMAIERCAVGRGVAAVRHKGGSRSMTYYAMHGLRDHFATFEAEGTVFGSINSKDFRKLPFLAPDDRVVKAFEGIVSSLDDRIETNERQSVTLAALRDVLLPKLISGELRVPDAERIAGRCAS